MDNDRQWEMTDNGNDKQWEITDKTMGNDRQWMNTRSFQMIDNTTLQTL